MQEIKKIANFYKALSDPTRLKLIKMLCENEWLCVNALTKRLDVTQSAVSQHLRVLKQLGLVESERRGYHIHYSLNKDFLKQYNSKISKELGEDFLG